jgi:hypothetical protein
MRLLCTVPGKFLSTVVRIAKETGVGSVPERTFLQRVFLWGATLLKESQAAKPLEITVTAVVTVHHDMAQLHAQFRDPVAALSTVDEGIRYAEQHNAGYGELQSARDVLATLVSASALINRTTLGCVVRNDMAQAAPAKGKGCSKRRALCGAFWNRRIVAALGMQRIGRGLHARTKTHVLRVSAMLLRSVAAGYAARLARAVERRALANLKRIGRAYIRRRP